MNKELSNLDWNQIRIWRKLLLIVAADGSMGATPALPMMCSSSGAAEETEKLFIRVIISGIFWKLIREAWKKNPTMTLLDQYTPDVLDKRVERRLEDTLENLFPVHGKNALSCLTYETIKDGVKRLITAAQKELQNKS